VIFNSKFIALCDPSNCAVEMGFSSPRTCLKAVCDSNSGSYSSLGTCERKNLSSKHFSYTPKLAQQAVQLVQTQELANIVQEDIIWRVESV